jgi:hypothetical protein
MKTKMMPRFWCDFCRKTGGSKSHMQRHENSCTLNPNRECRVCRMLFLTQKPIADLMALLPQWTLEHAAAFQYCDANVALPALREACGNCPACIMAALRQKRIPVPVATDFDFTGEMKAIWKKVTDERNCYDPLSDSRIALT